MRRYTWTLVTLGVILSLTLAACGRRASSSPNPASPTAAAVKGEKGGGEGGGGEAARGPTLTNPGGLPPAPQSGGQNTSQIGEERMVKVHDTAGRFGILFVDNWKQEAGSTSGGLLSSQGDWIAKAEIVPVKGQTPLQAARAVDSSQANGATGYQQLGIREGNVHGLPAASIIYQYEAGTSAVTGKPLKFVASQVFVGGGPTGSLGHVTFSAPYAYYGDISEIYDKILVGFTWK